MILFIFAVLILSDCCFLHLFFIVAFSPSFPLSSPLLSLPYSVWSAHSFPPSISSSLHSPLTPPSISSCLHSFPYYFNFLLHPCILFSPLLIIPPFPHFFISSFFFTSLLIPIPSLLSPFLSSFPSFIPHFLSCCLQALPPISACWTQSYGTLVDPTSATAHHPGLTRWPRRYQWALHISLSQYHHTFSILSELCLCSHLFVSVCVPVPVWYVWLPVLVLYKYHMDNARHEECH